MKHKHYPLLATTALFCAGLQTACVDNDYDLKNADMHVGVETDLTLPKCSTGDIYLKNFMDLKADGVVKYVWDPLLRDSVFSVCQTGTANIDPIRIDEIRVRKPQLSDINTQVSLRSLFSGSRVRVRIDHPLIGNQEVEVADKTFHYDLKPGDASYTISGASATGISRDVLRIDRVGFAEPVRATMQVRLTGLPSYIPLMHLDNLTLSYPRELNITRAVFNGSEAAIQPGLITLSGERGEALSVSRGLSLEITIEGFATGESFQFDAQRHRIDLNGDFALGGTFRVESSEFDEAALSRVINTLSLSDVQTFVERGEWGNLVPQAIGVGGSAGFDRDIVVKTFSGVLSHEVGNVAPVELDDLPDFLNDEDVVLDLDNPILFLNARNGLPATAHTSISLTSPTCGQPVLTETFGVAPGRNIYYIADKQPAFVPEAYGQATRLSVTGSLPALIRKIPKQVEVSVDPIRLVADNMDITQTYDVDVDYEIMAPFTCGPDFLLTYSDTETGWAADMKDLEKMDAERIELKGKADSNLPANCQFTLVPIDENGRELKALEVNTVGIQADSKGRDIHLVIKPAPGYTLNDALAGNPLKGVGRLDGVKYTARIDGATGSTLKKNASVRLYDMQVILKGTVTYDAN